MKYQVEDNDRAFLIVIDPQRIQFIIDVLSGPRHSWANRVAEQLADQRKIYLGDDLCGSEACDLAGFCQARSGCEHGVGES